MNTDEEGSKKESEKTVDETIDEIEDIIKRDYVADETIDKIEDLIKRDFTLTPIDQHIVEKYYNELNGAGKQFSELDEQYKKIAHQHQATLSQVQILNKMFADEVKTILIREGLSLDTNNLDMNQKPWRLFKKVDPSDAK